MLMGQPLGGSQTWGIANEYLLIQDRHLTEKPVPFIIRVPAAGYQTAPLTLHHVRTLPRVLLFRQLNYLSGAACANEFSAICRFPSRKLNLCHAIILCFPHLFFVRKGSTIMHQSSLVSVSAPPVYQAPALTQSQ